MQCTVQPLLPVTSIKQPPAFQCKYFITPNVRFINNNDILYSAMVEQHFNN